MDRPVVSSVGWPLQPKWLVYYRAAWQGPDTTIRPGRLAAACPVSRQWHPVFTVSPSFLPHDASLPLPSWRSPIIPGRHQRHLALNHVVACVPDQRRHYLCRQRDAPQLIERFRWLLLRPGMLCRRLPGYCRNHFRLSSKDVWNNSVFLAPERSSTLRLADKTTLLSKASF